ncbi:MAG TPA: M56 family metallopeptidase [Candidatus Bathyarchaeia archaeon]|nr:M56 family metallopeptidase [Candidatus Bathyarchaeia archaeon]
MWFVFHLLTVAVLAVLVELICTVLRPRPAVCHLLWLAVLIKLMMPPVVTWPWAVSDAGGLERFSVVEFAAAPNEEPAAPNGNSSGRAASSASPAPPQPFAIDMLSTGVFLWLFGAVCAAALQAFRLRKLRRISRHSTPAPDWLDSLAAEMAQRLDVRPPRVLLVEGLCSAVAVNAWRPKVLVSHELIGAIPREGFAGILAHELAHLKRRDLWAGLLEFAAQCAWWWNPLLYVVRRRLHLYREMAADAWVLWALPDGRRHYAETLVRVVDIASRQPAPMAAFGMASGPAATFERRLAMVLEAASPCRLPRLTLAATLLLLVLVAPGWSSARPETAPPGTVIDEVPASGKICPEPAMVAELRAFFTSSELSFKAVSVREYRLDDGKNHPGPQLPVLITGASEVVIEGTSLIMQGNELRWGENGKQNGDGVAPMFTATIGLYPEQKTAIRATLPEQDQKGQAPPEMEVVLHPEQDQLGAWIKTPQSDDMSDGVDSYVNELLPAPQDTWQAALISVPATKSTESGMIVLFWKVRPATPELAAQIETGETDDCRITYSPVSPFKGPYATAEFKIIDVGQTRYERTFDFSEPGTGKPGAVYHLQAPGILKNLLATEPGEAELISAPRVTFAVVTPPPSVKVLQRQGGPFTNLSEASEALVTFWEDARPTAVIADLRTETFVDRSKNKVQMHEGLLGAIAAKQTSDGTGRIDMRVLVEDLRLQRHRRGLAFWKPRRLPNALSNPVEVSFTCAFGETVVFEAPTLKPGKRRLIFLTIEKAERKAMLPRGL